MASPSSASEFLTVLRIRPQPTIRYDRRD